jgi:uncharacterized membrane protein YccC
MLRIACRVKGVFDMSPLTKALRAAGPSLLFGLRLWASACLALYVAFRLELDNPYWAAISASLVCQPQLGASLRKGWFRMIGTFVGAVTIVVMSACFLQDRAAFLISLSLWGGACAFAATLLRNFAAYAAALAGYTAAIIAGDLLGAVGGLNDQVFTLALSRVTEICIGIVVSGIVLAGTDFGSARSRLASLFADTMAAIAGGFMSTFKRVGRGLSDTLPVQRDLIRNVIALEPVIDQTIGEASQIRHHSPVLQRAVDGLFTALSGWREVANHLSRLTCGRAHAEAVRVLECLPPELSFACERADAADWISHPADLRQSCEAAIARLVALPADTPSLRLLADKSAEALAGLAHAFNGLALLVDDAAQPVPYFQTPARLHVPDWLPAVINAGRAFIVITLVAVFWIVTAWPGGAIAITWAAVNVILMSAQADRAYHSALRFTIGNGLAVVSAAIVLFAVLPRTQTFAGFSLAVGAYIVPVGALLTQPWETALIAPMAGHFFAFLEPANPMSYDPETFYNSAMAIIGGSAAAAAAFRLLPPLSPAFRARRLLHLTLRDLRRMAAGRSPIDWEDHIHSRLSVMPEEATLLQRARLLAALAVGSEIIQLRHITFRLGFAADLEPALRAIACGECASATEHLVRLDAALAGATGAGLGTQTVLRARGSTLIISEALIRYSEYFCGAAG